MSECYIFDLDGTLALIEHRRHFVASKPKNWKAFNAGITNDKPNKPLINILELVHRYSFKIVLCSGREEVHRQATVDWLAKHHIPYDELYMRGEKDYRSDDIIKKELLDKMRSEGYNPLAAFDDRDRVVKMWRDNGIPCYQVNYGDF